MAEFLNKHSNVSTSFPSHLQIHWVLLLPEGLKGWESGRREVRGVVCWCESCGSSWWCRRSPCCCWPSSWAPCCTRCDNRKAASLRIKLCCKLFYICFRSLMNPPPTPERDPHWWAWPGRRGTPWLFTQPATLSWWGHSQIHPSGRVCSRMTVWPYDPPSLRPYLTQQAWLAVWPSKASAWGWR